MILEHLGVFLGKINRRQRSLPETSVQPPEFDPFKSWEPVAAGIIMRNPHGFYSVSDVLGFYEVSGKYLPPTGDYKKDLPKGYTIIHSAMRSLARIGALGYRLNDGLRGNEEEIYSVKDFDLLVKIANNRER